MFLSFNSVRNEVVICFRMLSEAVPTWASALQSCCNFFLYSHEAMICSWTLCEAVQTRTAFLTVVILLFAECALCIFGQFVLSISLVRLSHSGWLVAHVCWFSLNVYIHCGVVRFSLNSIKTRHIRGQIHPKQLCDFLHCAPRLRGTYHVIYLRAHVWNQAGLTGRCRDIKLFYIILFTVQIQIWF